MTIDEKATEYKNTLPLTPKNRNYAAIGFKNGAEWMVKKVCKIVASEGLNAEWFKKMMEE